MKNVLCHKEFGAVNDGILAVMALDEKMAQAGLAAFAECLEFADFVGVLDTTKWPEGVSASVEKHSSIEWTFGFSTDDASLEVDSDGSTWYSGKDIDIALMSCQGWHCVPSSRIQGAEGPSDACCMALLRAILSP